MMAFFLIYGLVYGLLNLYVCLKLRAGFALGKLAARLLAFWIGYMILLPIFGRGVERLGHPLMARVFCGMGDTWMFVVLWVVTFGLATDLWNGLLRLATRLKPALAQAHLPVSRAIPAIALTCLVFGLWGAFDAKRVRLREIRIPTPRLAPGSKPIRVVQVSDVHLGPLIGRRHVARIVHAIRAARGDMLCLTGDLLDSVDPVSGQLTAEMAGEDMPLGKFAVIGNHEYYAGLARSIEIMQRAGFRVLRGEHVDVGEGGRTLCRVGGVDYPASARVWEPARADEELALPDEASRPFTILLKHRPVTAAHSRSRFDLQLSGHTHGAQVFPFHLYLWPFYEAIFGLHELPGGSRLYVNNGAGTWGPPLRLLAPAEVTVFVIEPGAR